jgi:AcrR family transcriptional regulator
MTSTHPTADGILDAAEELFAEQGFAATTVKQIGTRAGVNPALLYYYFDDKEALYQAMLARLAGAFVDGGMSRLADATRPADTLRRFVEGQVEVLLRRPRLARILARELVDRSPHVESVVRDIVAGLFVRLCSVIEAGQHGGAFRRDLDARFAAISTVSQIAYMFVARPAVGILLGHGPDGPPDEVVRAYARHAAAFALAALAAPAHPELPS